MEAKIKVGILTVSDSCAGGRAEDLSGRNLKRLIDDDQIIVGQVVVQDLVPDDIERIRSKLVEWCDTLGLDVVLTTGGTGCSPSDVTPEATRAVLHRELPGVSGAMLQTSLAVTPMAMLSRALCGTRGRTVVVNLPGSTKGAQECLKVVAPVLQHAVDLTQNRVNCVRATHAIVQSGSSTCGSGVDPAKQIPHRHGDHHHDHHQHHHHHEKSAVDESRVARRPRESSYPAVSVVSAVSTVLQHVIPHKAEEVNLADALHRVIAEEVFALEPLPPFRASIKDGYAVIAADGVGLRTVLGDSTAGSLPTGEGGVVAGTCLRISTGAPVPPGADSVIQVEDTRLICASEDSSRELEVEIVVPPTKGQDIREIGSDIGAGEQILSPGLRLGPSELGLLATVGVTRVKCHAMPRVAVMSTGNELVEPGTPLTAGKIRDSNRTVLLASLREQGFQPIDLGIVLDTADKVLAQMRRALDDADFIVTSGGVSMGEKDLIKDVLIADLGATVHFGRVQMKPGKPTMFATLEHAGRKKCFFGLPGNPVSATVTCHLYVLPALRRAAGEREPVRPTIKARLARDVTLDPRPEYHRCVLDWAPASSPDGIPLAHSTGHQISSRLLSLRAANGLLLLPPRTEAKTAQSAGSVVDCIVIGRI